VGRVDKHYWPVVRRDSSTTTHVQLSGALYITSVSLASKPVGPDAPKAVAGRRPTNDRYGSVRPSDQRGWIAVKLSSAARPLASRASRPSLTRRFAHRIRSGSARQPFAHGAARLGAERWRESH